MSVLFVNHKQQNCGVYEFGKRVHDLAKKSFIVSYNYIEVNSRSEFDKTLNEVNPNVILYNWYPVTMPWLTEDLVSSRKSFKHFFLFHDGNVRRNFDKYLFSGAIGKDINFPKDKIEILPRPLFTYDGTYSINDIPTIGSFGFGGWQKGFTSLVELVNKEFEEAIINIQMPFAYFGDRYGKETIKIAEECRKLNTNPKIILNIHHEFLSNDDVLKFLANNDINVFLYRAANQGLSSVIDYALSVRRPIAITNDTMFKHIFKKEISVDDRPLKDILMDGTAPLDKFYTNWNPDNFHERMDMIYGDK